MGSHRHTGGLSWGPVYMAEVTVDPCGHYRGGKKFCGHRRDRWGELWAPRGLVWKSYAMDIQWLPQAGHGALWTLRGSVTSMATWGRYRRLCGNL